LAPLKIRLRKAWGERSRPTPIASRRGLTQGISAEEALSLREPLQADRMSSEIRQVDDQNA
jgi:hypothetical protein